MCTCRAGLVHVTGGAVGTAVPTALVKLRYMTALVELSEGSAGGLHALLGSLFVKNSSLVNCLKWSV